MNLKEIREIINLMNDNDLIEIEVEREGTKIKIKKPNGYAPEVSYVAQPKQYVDAQPPTQADEEASTKTNANLNEIKSPMVGTFYRSPSPESPPFAEVGQVVEIGQVVCIVEAMKLMNEIKSETRGKVVEVSVENTQPVEFGQTLFALEPV